MFRNDLFTAKRPKAIKYQNETIFGEPEIFVENMPCHLSVKALSPVNQSQSNATVLYDFTLFYDTASGIILEANDTIDVTTAGGQHYELRAGESHIYPLTVQTHCEDVRIV